MEHRIGSRATRGVMESLDGLLPSVIHHPACQILVFKTGLHPCGMRVLVEVLVYWADTSL